MKKLFLLISVFILSFATTYHRGYVGFKKIVEKNIAGNIETIGNTVECVTNLKFAKSLDDINNASCSNDLNKNDNNYLIKYINVLNNNPSIFNSSTAVLKFPSSYKKIVWAALFWQGHINNYSYQYSFTNDKDKKGYDKHYNKQYYKKGHEYIKEYLKKKGKPYYKLSNDLPNNDYKNGIKQTSANEVKLFVNNISYDIEANEVDYKSNKRYFRNYKKKPKWLKKYGVKYSAYAILPQNIIDKLNSIAASNSNEVNITVANIKTTFGLDERLGDYGAWSLVVIYQEIPKPQNFKSNMVYYGFKVFNKVDQKINIPITGLVLPKYGNVSSRLSVFSGEGDYIYYGNKDNPESIRINGEYLDENLTGYNKYNVFDSRLSDDIERYPKLINNNGIDIDVFDASKQLTEIRNNEKEQNPSRVTYDVNITASTYNDAVFLSAIAFSTQLYVPKVCYYNLNLYDKNGNKITSSSKLIVGEKIKVQYKIKNDENKTAVNVNVLYPFDNNITKYIQNSTYVKNVLANEYNHIDDNHSVGNLGVEVNDTGLYIGILGDSNKEFLPYDTNSNYIAGIEFNLSLQKEGNLSFDFYTDYNYTIGGKPYSYKGILPNCNEFSNTYSVYQPKIGAFNVVETSFNSNTDPIDVNNSLNAIHTKIVDKDFSMKVIHLGDDNETLQNYDGNVTVKLINTENNSTLWTSSIIEFHNENNKTFDVNFTGNLLHRAVQKAAFRIFYKQNDENMSVDSRNQFAIRPYKFEIDTSNLPSEIKAGEDFNLTLKALSYTGNPALDYNETINIGSGDSPLLEYNDTNASKGCIRGDLNFSSTSAKKFVNGEANITLHYSDVGDLNITIKEINGSEFAKVDANDTKPFSDREINESNVTIKFIPDHFEINASLNNFENGAYTYISNDLNMSSILDLNITAENEQNQTTKNYNSKCYAKNFDLNISYQIPAQISNSIKKILIKETKEKNETTVSLPNIIIKNFPKTYFATDNNGTARLILHINFEKNYTNPVNEFNFTIKDINVSDEDNVTRTKSLEQNATFKYGRIDVQDISGYGNEINTTFKYEYWSDKNGWVVNKEHNSSNFGDINKSIAYQNFVHNQFNVNMNVYNIVNGEENVTISTTHALPYSTKIHLSIPSWLWYHPLAKPYKDPSSTNLDCLTHPCFNVNFQKQSNGWGGIGTNEGNYSAQKRTSEINASTSKIKANKSEVKKLNW